jgi:L-rhamnose mutarotase
MIRKAFLMEVKPGKIDEYEKSHNPIWPELHRVLKEHGLHNYSIFYHEKTGQLVGCVEIEDEDKLKKMAETDVCKKWWLFMKNFLVSESPEAPKAKEEEMREIFYMP